MLLILLLPMLLFSCGGETGLLYKDGEDVKASKKLFEKIKGYDENEPITASTDLHWLDSLKFGDGLANVEGVDDLDTYSDEDNAVAVGLANQPFQIFQLITTEDGKTEVAWSMGISDDPEIEFIKDRPESAEYVPAPVSTTEELAEGVAGLPVGNMNYSPVKYEIGIVPIHDTTNVNNKYEADHLLSFRIDKRDRVLKVLQWPEKHWQRQDFKIFEYQLEPGSTQVMVDTSRGKIFTLLIKPEVGEPTYLNLDKAKEITLHNFSVVVLSDRLPQEPPLGLKLNVSTDEDEGFATDFQKPLDDQLEDYEEYQSSKDRGLGTIRHANPDNYPNGYIKFDCTDLACQDADLFNTLVKWGAIGLDKNGDIQNNVIIAPDVLKALNQGLYEKNKKRIKRFKNR